MFRASAGQQPLDYASKGELRRGRVRRRIWNWIKNRARRRIPLARAVFDDRLPHGVRCFERDGLPYVVPTPAPRQHEDLDGARGIGAAIVLGVGFWVVILHLLP